MTVFTYPIVSYQCKLKLEFARFRPNTPYLLWWFGAVVKNPINPEEPLLQVVFREVVSRSSEGIIVEGFFKADLSASLISQYLIGSIWINGKSSEIVDFPEVYVELSFKPNNWSISSFNESRLPDKPYQNDLYPLIYGSSDLSKVIEFTLDSGEKILINCMEFFRASYGFSFELKRVLMTYPYQTGSQKKDSIEAILLPQITVPQAQKGEWEVVKPSYKYVSEDAIFLSHFKYDSYTQKVIKKLSNERIRGWLNTGNCYQSYSFLSVEPYHTDDDVKLIAKGIQIPNGFLALNILGISEPHGQDIILHTSNSRTGNDGTSSVFVKRQKRTVSSIQATSQLPANWNVENAVLPIKTQVIERNRHVDVVSHKSVSKALVVGKEAESFSSAPSKGNGSVGGLIAEVIEEEPSRFETMWNEAKSLKNQGILEKIEWYDGKGFHEQEPINSISFDSLPNKSSKVGKAFVMRLTDTNNREFVCVELTTRSNRDDFTGLLAEIEQSVAFAIWIRWILREVVANDGVFKKFISKSMYKNYKVYKHTNSVILKNILLEKLYKEK